MNCVMGTGVYLRANGELNCWCGPGEAIVLGQLSGGDDNWDFVRDHYWGPNIQHIRRDLRDGLLPFPSRCLKCYYFIPDSVNSPPLMPTKIDMMHLESSSKCNLKCPYCVHGSTQKGDYNRSGDIFLKYDLYSKIMHDILRAGINIKAMYFSGRGEPCLHPQIWSMVELAKSLFDTNFMVATNGNIPFNNQILDSGLDKLKIAVDSLDQNTYASYRIGGNVGKLLQLTEAIANEKSKKNVKHPEIVWQKVIFNFNTNPEELVQYQRKAIDCGVDTIRFVTAFTKEFPLFSLNALDSFFPNVELADGSVRNHIVTGKIDKQREKCLSDNDIAGLIQIVIDIMGWFSFGVETRAEEDLFYSLCVTDSKLYTRRKDDKKYFPLMKMASVVFSNIAALYVKKGQFDQASLYENWASKVLEMCCEKQS